MPLPKTLRFEVFKRDNFTCQYCGRKTPDVVLEADHIWPRSKGGSDDIENLLTACIDCNRGKGAVPLNVTNEHGDLENRAALIREREEQIRAYHEAQGEVEARRRAQVDDAQDHWATLYGGDLGHWECLNDSALARYVDELGPDTVKRAMDVAHQKIYWSGTGAVKYCYGVLRNMKNERV